MPEKDNLSDYTDKEDKKLNKEITPSQDVGTRVTGRPIQLGEDLSAEEELGRKTSIISKLIGKFDEWRLWRKPHENKWNEIYRMFFNQDDQVKLPTRAKVFVPMIFRIIESAVPLITNTIFASENIFDVVATNPKDQDMADLIKMLLTYQLGQADFFPKFIDFVKQLCLYGTSYFKVYWKVTRKWVWERTPIRKDINFFGVPLKAKIVGWKEEKKFKVVERRPEIDLLDVLDVFPDPDAANERDGEGVFIRTWMSMDDLREMAAGKYPVYEDVDSIKQDVKGDDVTFGSSRSTRLATRNTSNVINKRSKNVEVLEYWGKYDLDNDGIREECYIVIANRNTIIKAVGNPFHHQKRPIVRSVMFSVPLEWYGIGLVEPIMDQQHELNTLRRQRLDNINMVLNRMWKLRDTADVDPSQLISAPNHFFLVGEMDDLEPLETNDVTSNVYVETGALEDEMQAATISRAAQGLPESGRLGRTASGARLIVGQSLEKFSLAIRLVEETAIKRTLRIMHQLNLQFIDDDDVFRDPGMYGHLFDTDMTPEAIRAEVRFHMKATSEMLNSEAKINQLASFLGLSKDVLDGQSITQILRMIYKLMGFDPDDINLAGQALQPGVIPTPASSGDSLQNEIARNGTQTVPSAVGQSTPSAQ